MGRPWLLRPRPQPHRLRPASGRAGRIPEHRGRAPRLAGDRRLYCGGRSPRSPLAAMLVIDTNVARVMARLHALERPGRDEIRVLVGQMTPPDGAGDFAQAMMDLGATICRPKAPNCPACPLNPDCLARASGNPEAYPARPARRVRPQRHGIAHWIERDGAVWLAAVRPRLARRNGRAPGSEWTEAEPSQLDATGRVRHVFTICAELIWSPPIRQLVTAGGSPRRLDQAGLPTLYRRAAEECSADAGKGPKLRSARLKKRAVLPKGQALHDIRWPGRAEY